MKELYSTVVKRGNCPVCITETSINYVDVNKYNTITIYMYTFSASVPEFFQSLISPGKFG